LDLAKLTYDLAAHVRTTVRPLLGAADSVAVTGVASSGDATFGIDDAAEAAVEEFIVTNGVQAAYYTEDAGVREFGTPEVLLVIDPVDGSRPAIRGFEMCVVSVAAADYTPTPRIGDVRAGCVYEIKSDIAFVAERGKGARVVTHGIEKHPTPSYCLSIERAAWSAEFAGRPASEICSVLAEAIDASSIRGGFFVWSSTAYSLTRLVTGQLSAVVDVGGRVLKDREDARNAFLAAGFGKVVGLFPYDIAAAVLIACEAGCVVTDAYGKSLDDISLLDTSEENVLSIIAACTPELHARFLEICDRDSGSLGGI